MSTAPEQSTGRQHQAAEAAPDALLQLGHGFWGSKALLTAAELGLFSELAEAGALDAEALRERLGLHPRGVRDFFDALVALGMLECENDVYRNTPVTRLLLLDRSMPSYTFGSAASAFVVDALCEFRERYPGMRVSIAEGMPSSLIRRLRAGELDLAVVFDLPAAGEDIGEGLDLHHLLDQPFDFVLHPNHSLAGANRIRPADLVDEDWLLQDFGPDSPSLKLIGRMCAAAGFEPRVSFRGSDCQMTLAMVAAGDGVSILPRLMLDPLQADVVVKPVEGDTPIQRVAAVRLPTRHLEPAGHRLSGSASRRGQAARRLVGSVGYAQRRLVSHRCGFARRADVWVSVRQTLATDEAEARALAPRRSCSARIGSASLKQRPRAHPSSRPKSSAITDSGGYRGPKRSRWIRRGLEARQNASANLDVEMPDRFIPGRLVSDP